MVALGNILAVASCEATDYAKADCMQIKEIHSIHTDDVREIALDHHHSNIVLSGGFDKRLLITDIENQRIVKPFYTRHVIGSVRWYPTCNDVVSFTCDVGSISMFDIRDHSPRVPIVYHTGRPVCF